MTLLFSLDRDETVVMSGWRVTRPEFVQAIHFLKFFGE
jgi:hypothetical protein